MKEKPKRLLEGVRILHLADPVGSLCAALLADLGACVTGIADRTKTSSGPSTSSSRHPAIQAPIPGNFNLKTRNGKLAFRRSLQQSDVLIESFQPGFLQAHGFGNRQLQHINRRLIHISISGFGQTGPRKNLLGCDAVYAAYGGQMYVTGIPSGKPLKLAGRQAYNTASLFAANAVILNLRNRKRTGAGCHIDLSIQEAVASTLDHVLIDYFHDGTLSGRQGDDYAQEPFTVVRCKDGYIQIPILRNWDTIRELLESEGCAGSVQDDAWRNTAYRQKHYAALVETVQFWTQRQTKRKLFALGQAMGFPWAPILTPKEVLRSPQLKARGFLGSRPPTARHGIPIPGAPYRFCAGPAKISARPGGGNAPGPFRNSQDILKGIRVLDLTRLIAGPYTTRILGDFGAEVIKVQTSRTATGAEQNDTPAFRTWNRNKRSIGLDLNRPEARELLRELVSISDVVVENFSPRVLNNWGLTYGHLKTLKPDIILARISAMGQSGPWKNYVGFAPTFHALSGLTAATSRSLAVPTGIGYAFGDSVTALYASLAILAAIEYRDRTGSGHCIDIAAYEALCSLTVSADDEDRDAAPCGCYPCRGDDRWCVIAVFREHEWRKFCRILNHPELTAARFATFAGRKKYQDDLDAIISRWTTRYRAETVVRRLQKNGIAAGIVQNAADLAGDRQLAARNFFVRLRHPALGDSISDRTALWPWREKTDGWKPAPLLGEDNSYVFGELLGISETELRRYREKGIIEDCVRED
jgi:crotonobetainyl-CoA:carnitine CoA-transferase CaiB-like acyl-CoA transferase